MTVTLSGDKFMRYVILVLLLVFAHPAWASITEGGSGMLFGDDHAFYFTAPNGWVIDNESGVSQGLHMLFYPVGYTWSNSPVFAYGRVVARDQTIKSIGDQVKSTVDDFHQHGNPNYVARKGPSFALAGGEKIQVYFFSGDKWGNYEAAGYVEEKQTINFIVLNARSEEVFNKYWIDFQRLVQTYENAYKPQSKKDNATFEKLVKVAEQDDSTKEGKAYQKQFMEKTGQSMANFMSQCTSYTQKQEMLDFEIIFKIEQDGSISEAFVRPETTLSTCFRGLIFSTRNPPHKLKRYFQHIKMKVTE
jgi:hypothetical protein